MVREQVATIERIFRDSNQDINLSVLPILTKVDPNNEEFDMD